MLSFGTRGDVEPWLALALGLQQAGYEVTLGADADFETMIRARGIHYAPLVMNLRELLNTSDEVRTAFNAESQLEKQLEAEIFEQQVRPMLDNCWQAAQGADLLLYDTMLAPVAYHIAEKLAIPAIMTSVMPNMSPTRAFPLIGGPKIRLGGWANKLSYQLYRLSWAQSYPDLSRWAYQTLKLPPYSRFLNYWQRQGRPIPVLYSYSQHLLPSPPDWNATTLASGYWLLDQAAGWQPPPELEAFLAAGPAPLAIGFGSMVGLDPQHQSQIITAAVQQLGQRAILLTGWGGLAQHPFPDTIFCLAEAPHEWLFPRCVAVVHHGGSGTTGMALRCGQPSVICPFVTDQYFWGHISHRQGLSPAPIPQTELTSTNLAHAIKTVLTDPSLRQRVALLGAALRQEDGVARAVTFISQTLATA